MTSYDAFAEENANDELRIWVRRLVDATDDIVAFIDARLDGQGTGRYLGFLKGSFNISFRIGFGGQRPDAVIRFVKPGYIHESWRAEKVENEVRIIEYLSQHTTIPVPNVRYWGLAAESPQQLGPFIIMDFIPGIKLSTFLKQPNEDEDAEMVLNPDIDNQTLDTIYDQLADYILQMSRLEFPLIGAISKDSSGAWAVTRRPVTFDMNELATLTGFPVEELPTAPFSTSSDFFHAVARQRLLHLKTQRNVVKDEAGVKRRFTARRGFQRLIQRYCTDNTGPFKLFCDDLQPANMLIDPDSLRITAVLDFEFTNSMPAQYVCDTPWWLLLRGPDVWLDRDAIDEFVAMYVPRMKQFLRALERVEDKTRALNGNSVDEVQPRLSAQMRDFWDTGRFWFNCAARTSLDMDDIYWHGLYEQAGEKGANALDEGTQDELKKLVSEKMTQRKVYNEEWDAKFGGNESE